jgi:Tol biopolymer transport system component
MRLIPRYLLRVIIIIWLMIAALIGLAMVAGHLLPDSEQMLYTRSVDLNKRRYFRIYIRDSERQIDQRLTSLYGNNMLPSWSPDGKQIAYIGSNVDGFHVYVTDAVGQMARQFSYEFVSPSTYPVWSSDGKWILLSVSQMDIGETVILDSHTGQSYLLPQYIGSGSWSPDNQSILYQSSSESGVAHLYGMDIHCLEHVDSCQFEELNFLSDQPVYSVSEWSPNKQMLAFSSLSVSMNKIIIAQLRCMELNTNCIQHKDTVADDAPVYSNPIWSPDGKQLAFVEGHYALKVYQLETKTSYSFAIEGIYPFLKDWSYDGKFIAYISEQGGIANMYLLNVITGETHPLHNFLTSQFPEWRPMPH